MTRKLKLMVLAIILAVVLMAKIPARIDFGFTFFEDGSMRISACVPFMSCDNID